MLWYISGLHFREMSMRQNSGEPQKAGNYACSSHTNAICSYWSITLNDQTWQLLAIQKRMPKEATQHEFVDPVSLQGFQSMVDAGDEIRYLRPGGVYCQGDGI